MPKVTHLRGGRTLGLNPGRGLAPDPTFKNYTSQPQGKIPLIKQNLK